MPDLVRVWDRPNRSLTRVITDSETNLPLIIREHDASPLLAINQRQANAFDKHQNGWKKHGWQHVARLPPAVAARLRRIGLLNDRAAFDVWLNERDNRKFRVDDGRKV